ncbi:hypothetical protein [Streptomyces sp. NRRL WC-3742]|uniref:hypothetical protein n=1 Tax=Streptomyces sp. NRRL WC-3742 TaxID=1463934 RepID=UPI0004C9CBEA|nr:hypothetical protein [Streptomyces sp. NRRL WC-3742]
MIETTEHKATLTVRHGSVVGVRTDRMGAVLALTAGSETGPPAKLTASQCRELASYLNRQATELERAEKVERVSAPKRSEPRGLYAPFERRPLAGIDSHWEKR